MNGDDAGIERVKDGAISVGGSILILSNVSKN